MRLWIVIASILTILQVADGSAPTSPLEKTDTDTTTSAATADSPTVQDQPEPKPQVDIAEMSLEELMTVQVVVTASRREQSISSVPHAISVITAADIRAAGARSIPDALRLAAGIDVADLSYSNAAVAPRGFHAFTSRQVLVLVDGRQIFDSLFGGTIWGSWPFQLEDIERIEVIRGPAGVTWGANAVNGVINIITKDPADQLGATLTLGGGSRGAQKEHLGYAFREGNLRLRLSAEYEGSDGFNEGGSILGGLEDDYKAIRGGVYGIYEYGPKDTLRFSAGSGVVDGGFPRPPLGGFGWSRNPGSQASFLMGTWTHQVEKDNQLNFTAYVNDFYGSPGLPQIDYRYQQISLQLGHTFKPAEEHTLTWGIDTRTDLLDTTNSDPRMLSKDFVSTGTVGIYIQDDWRLAPKWSLGLGARLDYEFYGGFQPSARASLAREFDDGSLLYGKIARAFQMPPVGLRFLEIPMLNGLAWVDGDRELDSEILMAYEIGYRNRLLGKVDTSINVFWHEIDDATTLSPRLGPPGLLTLDLDNRAETSLYGVELDARYPITPRLTLLANYTFQEYDWRADVPLHDKDAMSPPRNKAMLGARYSPSKDLHLSTHLYYVDSVRAPEAGFPFVSKGIDPYLRVDLRAEYEFWNDRASIALGVRNLLDPQHPEGGTLFLNQAEVPRMVYVECRIHIP